MVERRFALFDRISKDLYLTKGTLKRAFGRLYEEINQTYFMRSVIRGDVLYLGGGKRLAVKR